MKTITNKGQSVLEYGLLIVVITAALIAMANIMQRAVSSNVKVLEDHFEIKPR